MIHLLSLHDFNSIMAYSNKATAIITNMVIMISYILLLPCRQLLDCREPLRFAVDDCDLALAATAHSLILPIHLPSNSTVLQVFYSVP